jgi:hypothetical protein
MAIFMLKLRYKVCWWVGGRARASELHTMKQCSAAYAHHTFLRKLYTIGLFI